MENYKNYSMTDVAFEIITNTKDGLVFKDLFNEVAKLQNLDVESNDEYISNFFTNLSLDGRFIILKNNVVDLTNRHTLKEREVDLQSLYDESEEEAVEIEYDNDDPSDDESTLKGEDEESSEENY